MGRPWLIVGLGNPGPKYALHRHNIGFIVVDHLQERFELPPWKRGAKFDAEVTKGRRGSAEIVLAKPQTFMNLSGRSVALLARFYQVEGARIVVIHDEIDLERGRLKVKVGGGDGGHNGLRSLTRELGNEGYIRVRFGVGRPERGDVSDYVLSRFDQQELDVLGDAIERAETAVETIISQGVREAMNCVNGQR